MNKYYRESFPLKLVSAIVDVLTRGGCQNPFKILLEEDTKGWGKKLRFWLKGIYGEEALKLLNVDENILSSGTDFSKMYEEDVLNFFGPDTLSLDKELKKRKALDILNYVKLSKTKHQ